MVITCRDTITHIETLTKAGLLPSTSDILTAKGLRGLGYIHRMELDTLSRQLLYLQLQNGTRRWGRPKLRYKDVMKRNMKHPDINSNTLQLEATDRKSWKELIKLLK